MKFLAAIPLLAATLLLSSCILGGGTKTPKTPVVPAALDPNAMKPVAPPPPLSSPQTDIQLPPEQTLTAEALATIQMPPPAPPEAAPAKTPPSKKQVPVAAAPKPETPAPPVVETPSPAAPPAGPPAPAVTPEEQPRLQPVYTEEEKRRISAELEKRRNETEGLLRNMTQSRSAELKPSVDRVRSYITVADEAIKRGDFHSADAFSMRALVLARELAGGR